jgi:hypothetical protein
LPTRKRRKSKHRHGKGSNAPAAFKQFDSRRTVIAGHLRVIEKELGSSGNTAGPQSFLERHSSLSCRN